MPSLNIDFDYFDHPKTRRLVGLLGKGADVYPIRLWAFVGKYHADNGELRGYNLVEIESILTWEGDRGALVDAMCRVGFLHPIEGEVGYVVHDWIEHEGHIIAYRDKAKKMAKSRWKGSGNAPSNASSIAPSNANAVQCNAVQCSAIKPILGDGVPEIRDEVWEAFLELRAAKKAPLTETALKMMVTKLNRFYSENKYDPNDVLEQSVNSCWVGVFPLTSIGRGKGNAGNAVVAGQYHGQPSEFAGVGKTVGE